MYYHTHSANVRSRVPHLKHVSLPIHIGLIVIMLDFSITLTASYATQYQIALCVAAYYLT